MRKSTFFWRELHRLSPLSVERCACIWMNNGARARMREFLGEQYDIGVAQIGGEQATPDGDQSIHELDDLGNPVRVLDAESAKAREEWLDLAMGSFDVTHQHERRVMLSILLVSGIVLTAQPYLPLNFLSLPLALAGAMLLGLEFSPRTGVGFVGMIRRFKADRDQKR